MTTPGLSKGSPRLPPINYEALNHLFTKLPFSGRCEDCQIVFDDETYYFCHQPCHQDNYRKTCPPERYDPNCYQCSLCSKVATNFTNLRYHYQYHAARRFQCLKCDYNAHSLAEIRRHVQNHLDSKLFPCRLCPRQYPDAKTLKEHLVRGHRSDAEYICSQCVAPFSDKNIFSVHIDKHFKEAARRGEAPGKLYDLRTGSTPSGQSVSSAFRIRRKKRRSRATNEVVRPIQESRLQPQFATQNRNPIRSDGPPNRTIVTMVRDSSFQPTNGSKPSLLSLVRQSQFKLKNPELNTLPTPSFMPSNGMKTYATRQTASKVCVGPRRSQIAPANVTRFATKPAPVVTVTNGSSSYNGRTVIRNHTASSVRNCDIGTFVPPTTGLADYIETDS